MITVQPTISAIAVVYIQSAQTLQSVFH